MVLHHRANEGSPMWQEWHEKRALFRELLMSDDELGAIDREKYDTETARITGQDNPRTYQSFPRGLEYSTKVAEWRADVQRTGWRSR